MATLDRKDQQIISHLHLRMLIGLCGVLLPLACLFYGLLPGNTVQDSISDFYYTDLRDIFVGILFALGLFLLTYKGYEAIDSRFSNAGFFFALGVALFPCKSEYYAVHFISAFLLFAVFIFFSLVLFTKSVRLGGRTKERDERHVIYIICGWIMVTCIIGIAVTYLFGLTDLRAEYNLTFWFESIALFAFAFSWLTKGMFYHETLKLVVKTKQVVDKKKDADQAEELSTPNVK